MAAWAEATARAEAAPRARPRPPARRRRAQQRSGVLGGVLWIAGLAVLLAGVVALNVAVLQLNVRLDRLAQERANLRAANAALSSQLSSAAAPPHLEALARKRLQLEPAGPERITYVELGGR